MKSVVKIFFATLFFLCSSFVFANDLTLKSICSDLSSNQITKGDFLQSRYITTSKGKTELKSNGKFIFCLDGIVWNTEKPFPSSMVITTKKIIQTQSNGKKTVIDGADKAAFANVAEIISSILTGDFSKLEENFNLNFETEASQWKLTLNPKNETLAQTINAIELKGGLTSAGKAQLEQLALYNATDISTKYIFSNHIYTTELTANENAFFTE